MKATRSSLGSTERYASSSTCAIAAGSCGSAIETGTSRQSRTLRGPIERYFQSENRFRDTVVSPDGKTIYVATDNGGLAEALGGGTTDHMQNPGSILVFTFKPD